MTDTVERVAVEVVGDVTGVNAAMREAAASVRASTANIQQSATALTSSLSTIRGSTQSAASGFLTMEQAIEAEMNAARQALQPAQAFEQATHSSHLTSRRFANELLNVTRAALGFEPVLGKVATELGFLTVGGGLMTGVFAALAGLALYWDHVSEAAKKAKEEQDAGIKTLEDIRDKGRNPVLGGIPHAITEAEDRKKDREAALAAVDAIIAKQAKGMFGVEQEKKDQRAALVNEIGDLESVIRWGHAEEDRLNAEHAADVARREEEAARKREERERERIERLKAAGADSIAAQNDMNQERKRLYDEQTDDALRALDVIIQAQTEADDMAKKWNESFAKGQNDAEEASKRLAKEYREEWKKTFDSVRSSFGSAIEFASTRAGFLREVWRSVWYDMVRMSARFAADEVSTWAAKELVKSGITKKAVADRVADELWGSIKSIAIATWEGVRWIAIQAAKAAAGAWAALSGIPVVGPALGAAAAVATLAGVLALAHGLGGGGGSPSVGGSAGRTATAAVASQSRGGGAGSVIHIHAVDAESFRTFAKRNRGALVDAVVKSAREQGITL